MMSLLTCLDQGRRGFLPNRTQRMWPIAWLVMHQVDLGKW